LGHIAHEINNPLESVLNLLYLIRQADSLEQARQYALQAEEEIQRAAHIASGTLNFQKQQSRPVPTQMAELLD
jgi:signal transduction histidine kinase